MKIILSIIAALLLSSAALAQPPQSTVANLPLDRCLSGELLYMMYLVVDADGECGVGGATETPMLCVCGPSGSFGSVVPEPDMNNYALMTGASANKGQTIQGRTGDDRARVEIGMTASTAELVGNGAVPGRCGASGSGVSCMSGDGTARLSLTNSLARIYYEISGYSTSLSMLEDGSASFSVNDGWGNMASIDLSPAGGASIFAPKVAFRGMTVPATATDACAYGQVSYDASYYYICIAADTWKRTPLSTW